MDDLKWYNDRITTSPAPVIDLDIIANLYIITQLPCLLALGGSFFI